MAPSLPLRLAALALAACAPAAAQSFGPITALPGLAVLPPYKMSSGYINYTSPMLGSAHHTFHWVAESQGNPATDPILLWTNGGPGCSGLYGMGFENGPFLAQQDGSLTLNPMSWNRFATVRNIREQTVLLGLPCSSARISRLRSPPAHCALLRSFGSSNRPESAFLSAPTQVITTATTMTRSRRATMPPFSRRSSTPTRSTRASICT